MSIGFAEFLKAEGFKEYKRIYNKSLNRWEDSETTKYDIISSLSNIFYIYKKDEYTDIFIGLNERDLPPTLIWPIPITIREEVLSGKIHLDGFISRQQYVEKYYQKLSYEELLKELI